MWLAMMVLWIGVPLQEPSPEALIQNGNWEQAETLLNQIILQGNENHTHHFWLGRVQFQKSDWSAAIRAFKQAVKGNSQIADYHYWLGASTLEKLKVSKGFQRGMLAGRVLETLQKAIALDPKHLEARKRLAHYYLNAPAIAGGSKRKAMAQAEAIMKLDPDEGVLLKAGIHRRGKEYDKAVATYHQYLEQHPRRVDIYRELGQTYVKWEHFEQAIEAFEKAYQLDESDFYNLYLVGRTAALSGTEMRKGLEALELYLTLNPGKNLPGKDAAFWRMGMIYEKLGHRSQARKYYEQAVQKAPDQTVFRDSLNALLAKMEETP